MRQQSEQKPAFFLSAFDSDSYRLSTTPPTTNMTDNALGSDALTVDLDDDDDDDDLEISWQGKPRVSSCMSSLHPAGRH